MLSTKLQNYRFWIVFHVSLLGALAVFSIAATTSALILQPGDLDPTFGNGGKVTTPIGTIYDEAHSVAIQPDGKIVTAGFSWDGSNYDFAVVRYNSEGTLDTTFDGDGKVTTPVGTNADYAEAVAIQPNGKIVAAGWIVEIIGDVNLHKFAIVRYNPDGSLDTSFDADGKVVTPIGTSYDEAYSVAIQSDGKIVAAGTSANGSTSFDFALVRYNTNGTLDTSFDSDGKVVTDFANGNDFVHSVVIQSDGKIVVAGTSENGSTRYDFALARYNAEGSLDASFDVDGKAVTDIGEHVDVAGSAAIQSDGKIVAAGLSYLEYVDSDFAVVRYNTNGTLDTSFADDGKIVTDIGRYFDAARSVAIQSDGKIVAAGSSENSSLSSDFAVVRYKASGLVDSTFGGGDGITTVDFNNETNDHAYEMTLDSQGRAVVVGQSYPAFAVARIILGQEVVEPSRAPFDFDGDGRSDVSVFRPSDSVWYLDRSTDGFQAVQFGAPTDKIVPADYDGDGKTDIAVFRDGTWWRINSGDSTIDAVQFGQSGDIPVPADYTGDGRDDLAVYRNGQWWTRDLSNGNSALTNFGVTTDKPVPADYDGDGKTDIAIYRDGAWWRINSGAGSVEVFQFGLASDRPVVGDYDGDSKADQAVYRDGTWYLQKSRDGFATFSFGIASDIPTPADYDGDGKADAAVYRNGTWYLNQSSNGVSIQQFGLAGDTPAPTAYLP
jgi:uncharacterized delta-60 repeat protein